MHRPWPQWFSTPTPEQPPPPCRDHAPSTLKSSAIAVGRRLARRELRGSGGPAFVVGSTVLPAASFDGGEGREERGDTSSDESDDDTEVVVAMTLLSHDHEENQRPLYRGSLPGRSAALDHNQDAGQTRLFLDYLHRTNPMFKEKPFPAPLSDVKEGFHEDSAQSDR
jgi:hypothetical protein